MKENNCDFHLFHDTEKKQINCIKNLKISGMQNYSCFSTKRASKQASNWTLLINVVSWMLPGVTETYTLTAKKGPFMYLWHSRKMLRSAQEVIFK